MVSIYDSDALEELRRRHAIQPHRMKQFKNAFFKNAYDGTAAVATLPQSVQSDFSKHVAFQSLELFKCQDSEVDGASKLIFKTTDGHLIESVVLRPKTGRTSLCISSQIGCACNCTFCATGQMGFTRNLTTPEILDQVAQANRLVKPEGRTIRNVVFMGMGEPLQNLRSLFQSLQILMNPALFNYAGSRLMISTVGIPAAMEQFSEQFPSVQLALSLHSARQNVREKLMPLAKKYPLDTLRNTLIKISQHGKIMIEYLMLDGVNDQPIDRLALENYLHGIPAHINLIPFNETSGCTLHGTPLEARKTFADQLKSAGFQTTLRYSLGTDIAAACGQLVQRNKR
jgi:23S rRNA (adenine2503-C2)-methyltransferase